MSFAENLKSILPRISTIIQNGKQEWTVRGFIDIFKNIYSIGFDTKVISKVVELMIFPILASFAQKFDYKLILSEHQNFYPDMTFITERGEKIAVDVKSSYRISDQKINGMTLGAFSGYFRNRDSQKNITYPYNEYAKHFVLGIIYTRADLVILKDKLEASFDINLTREIDWKNIRECLSVNLNELRELTDDPIKYLINKYKFLTS